MKAHICGKPLEAAETGQIEQSGEQSLKEVCDGKTTTTFQL